jgi:EAL domain-containing protein (putative c-di-GMP-specific phosphodiesterase class I)/FixJ family two-component response regulator
MTDWSTHTVMVVEDSRVQRAHLVDLMRQLGFFEVLEASDGNEALGVLEQHGKESVFLVITDLEMPGMDGIELTRHLTERHLAQNLIVVSARDPRLLEIIESIGAADPTVGLLGTVVKPVMREDVERLLQQAHYSMQAHKTVKKTQSLDHLELEAAIKKGEFIPYYQPKISMHSGFIKGTEALARWRHPERGILAPLHFISALEGSALMAPFTLAMLEQILPHLVHWQRRGGMPALTVSVNLSAENLADRDFIEQISKLPQAHGLSPQSIIWEVTETMLMNNLSQSLANLGRLRLMGFGLAMDDFGIGYSSMQQLSRCPFTELKIDRAFVDGASKRPNRRVILESSIALGRSLGVTTVAEGVEAEDDWKLLVELGCDLAQGYLIAKPMPFDEIIGWVKNNRTRLRSLVGNASYPHAGQGTQAE